MNASERVVVDASVVVKWFVQEGHSSQALLLHDDYRELLAPDLVVAEVGNVFLKKLRAAEVQPDYVQGALMRLPSRLRLFQSASLATTALAIAVDHRRSFYDALYVALALSEGCPLVTADQRLYNSLQSQFAGTMLWLGDLPSA